MSDLRPVRPIAMLVASWLAAMPSSAQVPGEAPPPPSLGTPTEGGSTTPEVATDGAPAEPERIPADADPVARERWERACAELAVTGTEALRSFDLPFRGTHRLETGNQEFRARFLYLDEGPGFVRGTTLDANGDPKRSQMRGPSGERLGYWYVEQGKVHRLTPGENREGRREIDGWAVLAQNLLLLAQPQRMRLAELRETQPARLELPAGADHAAASRAERTLVFPEGSIVLPDVDATRNFSSNQRSGPLATRAASLDWVRIATPDLRLLRADPGASALRRVLIGLDRATGLPAMAVVTDRAAEGLAHAGAVLVQLERWEDYGSGRKLPRAMRLFELREDEVRTGRPDAAFQTRSSADLFLLPGGRLGVDVGPEDFRPEG